MKLCSVEITNFGGHLTAENGGADVPIVYEAAEAGSHDVST